MERHHDGADLGDDGFTMVPFGQGFKDMSPPTKELMRLVLEHKLAHGGHALFLKHNPLCAKCRESGKLTPATVVDHIVPHRGDSILGALQLAAALQGLPRQKDRLRALTEFGIANLA